MDLLACSECGHRFYLPGVELTVTAMAEGDGIPSKALA
jgi:hypothetical protein